MVRNTTRILSLVVIAATLVLPIGRVAAQSIVTGTNPPPPMVTGTNPEPGVILVIVLSILPAA